MVQKNMFGGGYGYRGGSRTPRRNPSAIDASKIRKWRVIAEKPIPVAEDDEGKVLVYDLEPRTLCDVAEQKHMPNGEIRAMIVDPVWKGWVTLKTRGGDSLCEPVDDDSGTSNGAFKCGGEGTLTCQSTTKGGGRSEGDALATKGCSGESRADRPRGAERYGSSCTEESTRGGV